MKAATDEYFDFLQNMKDSNWNDENNYMIDVEFVDENGEEKIKEEIIMMDK